MFKNNKKVKNYYFVNELIAKGMIKRRRFAGIAVSNICDTKIKMKVIK